MLPGIESGLGSLTLRLGVLPLLASAGAFPFTPLSGGVLKPLMTVPSGLPPSMTCSCPASSMTVMDWNCISSLGMFRTLPTEYGFFLMNSGWDSSCACRTGIIALLVVSNENLTLP